MLGSSIQMEFCCWMRLRSNLASTGSAGAGRLGARRLRPLKVPSRPFLGIFPSTFDINHRGSLSLRGGNVLMRFWRRWWGVGGAGRRPDRQESSCQLCPLKHLLPRPHQAERRGKESKPNINNSNCRTNLFWSVSILPGGHTVRVVGMFNQIPIKIHSRKLHLGSLWLPTCCSVRPSNRWLPVTSSISEPSLLLFSPFILSGS